MLDFKERRKVKRLLYSKFTIVVLGLVLLFLLSSVFGVYKKASIAYGNKNRVDANLTELKNREKALLLNIEKLKTKRGVESEIRDKFGVVKKGEELVVIVDPINRKEQNSIHGTMSPRGIWQKFIGIFKD